MTKTMLQYIRKRIDAGRIPEEQLTLYEIIYEMARRVDALESNAQNTYGTELAETVLGERIRTLRLERGMTLAELAQSASMSLSYLSDIERGKPNANPTVTTLRGIAAALDVSVAHLFANGDES